MSNLTFSLELAQQLYDSAEQFPVDFDDAWQWLGYSTKQKAFQKLRNNFDEGLDFLTTRLKSPTGGRPSDCVSITVDCFKSLGMMVGTEQGKQIRRYFLECEKIAKAALQELQHNACQPQLPQVSPEERLVMATGAVERAEELGFGRIGADLGQRIKLGKWVGKYRLTRRKEKRLCCGEIREIWLYQVSDELDSAITDFFV